MSDDKPLDQGDEENDEFFSARETQRMLVQQKNSPDPLRSDRESPNVPSKTNSSRSDRASNKSKRSPPPKNFFSDERAVHSDKSGKRRSEKAKKDKNKWDGREYKKEELDMSLNVKKKKKIKPQRLKTVEASKTDEESDEDVQRIAPPPQQTRPFFTQQQFILSSKTERPVAPKCRFRTIRFTTTMEIIEFDAAGDQPQLGKFPERAVTNPWRRWGAHRTLCDQGGYIVGQKGQLIRIERGSPRPPLPPDMHQVTLNKNAEIPNSQSLCGTIRVQPGPAVFEGHRIGREIEGMVDRGGFVPKKAVMNLGGRGQPQAVVQKGKKKKKDKDKKKKNKKGGAFSSTESSTTDEDTGGSAEKIGKDQRSKVKDQRPKAKDQPEAKDDSKKGGGGQIFSFFFKRNKGAKVDKEPRQKARKKT